VIGACDLSDGDDGKKITGNRDQRTHSAGGIKFLSLSRYRHFHISALVPEAASDKLSQLAKAYTVNIIDGHQRVQFLLRPFLN
jgi:hypothetical protein